MTDNLLNKTCSILLISCVGALAYFNSFHCAFHFDDGAYIINDPAIRNIQDLQRIWGICPSRFVTFFTLALNYHFHKLHVFGYHVVNLAFHLATALLVWWLTLLTFSTPSMKENEISKHGDFIALFAGLIFVSHPVQVEAVTYIWQRAASIAAFFYLASLCFYVRSRLSRDDRSASGIYYYFSFITAVAAMFSKENAVTLPLMVILYEFFFFGPPKRVVDKYAFSFLPLLSIIPLTVLLAKSGRFQAVYDMSAGSDTISPWHYFLTQLRVLVTYVRLDFLPFNQNFDYDYPVFKSIFELPVFSGFMFLIAVICFAVHLFSKYRIVSFAIFWFLLTLLPESSFLPLKDVIFEHRLYLPLAGYSIFLASGAYYLWGKNNIYGLLMALSLIIACYAFLTFQRNKVWRDEITLFNDTVQKSPHKARPYSSLGVAYIDQGNFTRALFDLNKVIAIDPSFRHAYFNRGAFYEMQGDLARAISDYDQAIKINPMDAEAYFNRGNIYNKQNDPARAVSDYSRAIEANPRYGKAYLNRGITYRRLGDITKALADLGHAKAIIQDE